MLPDSKFEICVQIRCKTKVPFLKSLIGRHSTIEYSQKKVTHFPSWAFDFIHYRVRNDCCSHYIAVFIEEMLHWSFLFFMLLTIIKKKLLSDLIATDSFSEPHPSFVKSALHCLDIPHQNTTMFIITVFWIHIQNDESSNPARDTLCIYAEKTEKKLFLSD